VAAFGDYRPARLRARRSAGLRLRRRAWHLGLDPGGASNLGDGARFCACPVVHGHRDSSARRGQTARNHGGPHDFRRPAVSGPHGGAAPVHGRHARNARRRPRHGCCFFPGSRAHRFERHRARRPASHAASISSRRGGWIDRIFHGRLSACGHRNRRSHRGERFVDGTWRLHRRHSSRRNRVPPRDRSND
jgi:hypothetical protein